MKRIINTFILGISIVGMSSCLKDKNVNLSGDDSPAVVEWSTSTSDIPASPANSTYPLYVRSYAIAPSVDVPFVVNYTGTDAANEDVTLTLGINSGSIAQYNNERLTVDLEETHLELLPSSYYTLPTTVVIPKGQHKATVIAKLKTNLFTDADFSKQYVLPISITAASGNTTISRNYGTVLYQLGAKNAYDGNYNANGTITFPASQASSNRSWTNRNKAVTTVNATTCRVEAADLGTSSYYMNMRINADNTVTITSAQGAATSTLQNDGACTYDPATKKFTLNYKYIGGTGDRKIAETLTLK
jgi:hypothetical protein